MSFEETLAALLDARIAPLRREIQRLTTQLPAAPNPEESEFLSVTDAANLAAVSETTVRDWMTEGLKRYGHGRVVRIRRTELIAFLDNSPAAETDETATRAERARLEKAKAEEQEIEGRAVSILSRRRRG